MATRTRPTTTDSTSESSADDLRRRSGATGELDEVSFSGEVGESITATWNSEVEPPDETTVTTLVKGDGEAVADGDTVSTYLWVGNGTAKEDVYSDYDNGAPEPIPNDAEVGEVFHAMFEARRTAPGSSR